MPVTRRKARSKYGAVKTEVDGIVFDSKKEAARYQELKLMERAGEIRGLVLQPTFVINVEGKKICSYKADFRYELLVRGRDGLRDPNRTYTNVVEDVKGVKTPVYRLKKKLVKACHGIDVTEV